MNHLFRLALILLLLPSFSNAQSRAYDKIHPEVNERFYEQEQQEVLISFSSADLPHDVLRNLTKEDKATLVYNHLLALQKEQNGVKAFLDAKGIAYESLWIVNVLKAKLKAKEVESIAQLKEVKSIATNPMISFSEPIAEVMASQRAAVEWGIERIGAVEVWNMGYEGQGVVVGGQDTGIDWEHPALQEKYRGWNDGTPDHNYNWHDAIHEISPLHGDSIITPELNPCGLDITVPCDDHSHGTHTMGTMIGSEGENQIGVAPQAKWIGVRNMERGYGTPFTYLEGFQWFLAPTDLNNENADPSKAPHVINNSWGCPEMEGCNPSNFALLEDAVNNLKASGVVVVVSAGNSGGAGCGSVSNPAAIYENSFSVGATRFNDTIAGFSSRGPVMVDGSMRLKPNVSAPGTGVRSSVLNGGYSASSGTSMAGPHVVGAVALMISANPELAGQVEMIETILETTAVPKTALDTCGTFVATEVPNHVYGYGRIDAHAAVVEALNFTSTTSVSKSHQSSLFPNPASDVVMATLPKAFAAGLIQIYDASGRLVQVRNYTGSDVQLNVADLSRGIYFVHIDGENGQAETHKLILN